MILNHLTKVKGKPRKPLPAQIFARLVDLKGEEISAQELSRFLATDTAHFRKVMKDIITPCRYETMNGKVHAIYSVPELKQLGNYFLKGFRWRKKD